MADSDAVPVVVEDRSTRALVTVDGAIDHTLVGELEAAFVALARPQVGRPPILVDLKGAPSVDAMDPALARRLRVATLAAEGDEAGPVPRVRFVNAAPAVERALVEAGLGAHLIGAAPPPAERAASRRGYADVLRQLREAFPTPTSDPRRDAYFVYSIARGLDRVDRMKGERPYLGERRPLDYDRARAATLDSGMRTVEEVIEELAGYLEGLTIWGHPRTQENVIPPATIPSIVGSLLAAAYNPNVIWDEYSRRIGEAEVEAAAIVAELVGYEPADSAGIFTWGGTGTIFYGVRLGVEKAAPGAFKRGIRGDLKVVASEVSHYAKLSALGWLGLGTDNLVTIPADADNAIDLEALEVELRRLCAAGERIACIMPTMGTTDAFSIDHLAQIVAIRDALVVDYDLDYRPHIHADAVIGWAWAVFRDYDFDANPLAFPARTLRSLWDANAQLCALGLADSIGVDFHKTGFTPYVASLFLVRDRGDFDLVTRDLEAMPYLFQFGNYHPGVFTMETSRAGSAVLAALANLRLFGKEGLRALLGHLVGAAEELRQALERSRFGVVVNDYNHGPVTLFRVYPEGVDPEVSYRRERDDPTAGALLDANNAYNHRIFAALQRQMDAGDGVALSLTERYRDAACGRPIVALKSFVMSPFIDAAAMDEVVACLERARVEVAGAAD